jgi:hypothetical protein
MRPEAICQCGELSRPQINVLPNQPVYCSRCGCRVPDQPQPPGAAEDRA